MSETTKTLTDAERDEAIAQEIIAERRRQDDKWGQQNHPSVYPYTGTVESPASPRKTCYIHHILNPDDARECCESRFRDGKGSWADIAQEEFSEAVGAVDEAERRAELVQLGAVISAWIACTDRNSNT